jgi:deazaflavin-dependent oxidoreductase (nitroreductase family)
MIQNTPDGTYGARVPGGKLLRALFEPLGRRAIDAYRRSGGTNPMARMMGFPVVLLTTRGSRSGQSRTVQLGCFDDGQDAWLIVASNGGARTHPAWFHNMVSNPDEIWLEVGRRKLKVRGESLTGEARVRALQRIAAISPRYGKYQQRTDREIPIVRLTPA